MTVEPFFTSTVLFGDVNATLPFGFTSEKADDNAVCRPTAMIVRTASSGAKPATLGTATVGRPLDMTTRTGVPGGWSPFGDQSIT